MTSRPDRLSRRLGHADAVMIGLGAMLGAGVFVAFGPAAAAAGAALPVALLLAGLVAWANADSSARLAAGLPTSGGAYAYGRARLSPAWGSVAGFAFLIGKTISAGAIAGAAGSYLWPGQARPVAVAAVVALTAVACAGVERSAQANRIVVVVVLLTLAAVVVAAIGSDDRSAPVGVLVAGPGPALLDVLRGAGVLFFAFAGYARIATLGEEVVDPRRTIPRAVAIALGIVLLVYAAVGGALLTVLGGDRLAASSRPVADAVAWLGGDRWVPAVVLVAAAAALASGLGVLLGLSRTVLAMSRDRVLPAALAHLDGPASRPRPVRAQLVIGGVVVAGVLLLDLTQAITLSSAAVLVYYAVAHLAALTLPGRRRRAVPVLGLVGCLLVSLALLVG